MFSKDDVKQIFDDALGEDKPDEYTLLFRAIYREDNAFEDKDFVAFRMIVESINMDRALICDVRFDNLTKELIEKTALKFKDDIKTQ